MISGVSGIFQAEDGDPKATKKKRYVFYILADITTILRWKQQ